MCFLCFSTAFLSSAVPQLEHPEGRLVLGWRQVCVSPQSRCQHQEVVPLGQTGDLLVVAGGRVTSLGERIWPHYTYGINTEISHSQLQL